MSLIEVNATATAWGGSTFNYGFSLVDERKAHHAVAVAEAKQAKIAVLMLPGLATVTDLKAAADLGAGAVRIATHCTEADVSIQHFTAARELGLETVGFLMLSHMSTPAELAEQGRIMVDAGCQCVRGRLGGRADSRGRVGAGRGAGGRSSATTLKWATTATRTMSFGVANSVLAYRAGARQIDGSLLALGAGAGNSPTEVLVAVFEKLGVKTRCRQGRPDGRGRERREAVHHAVAGDGPVLDRAGLRGCVLLVPAAC